MNALGKSKIFLTLPDKVGRLSPFKMNTKPTPTMHTEAPTPATTRLTLIATPPGNQPQEPETAPEAMTPQQALSAAEQLCPGLSIIVTQKAQVTYGTWESGQPHRCQDCCVTIFDPECTQFTGPTFDCCLDRVAAYMAKKSNA